MTFFLSVLSRIHVVGIQRKGAKPLRRKAVKSKSTSAGPGIAFTKPCFQKPEPKVIKTFAPSLLCAFAIKIFRVNPVKKDVAVKMRFEGNDENRLIKSNAHPARGSASRTAGVSNVRWNLKAAAGKPLV
jgi:hypothetical protein